MRYYLMNVRGALIAASGRVDSFAETTTVSLTAPLDSALAEAVKAKFIRDRPQLFQPYMATEIKPLLFVELTEDVYADFTHRFVTHTSNYSLGYDVIPLAAPPPAPKKKPTRPAPNKPMGGGVAKPKTQRRMKAGL